MKANLSDYASIAEIAAAICVVISLIFVGFQINEGNRETRAATAQAVFDSELLMTRTFIEQAETWDKVLNGVALEPGGELRKGINLYNMAVMETENRFRQVSSGFLDSSEFEIAIDAMRPIRHLPIYEIWIDSAGASSRSSEFMDIYRNLSATKNVE